MSPSGVTSTPFFCLCETVCETFFSHFQKQTSHHVRPHPGYGGKVPSSSDSHALRFSGSIPMEPFEQNRVLKAAKEVLGNNGVVVTFQKNAWEGLRADNDPPYNIKVAKKGKLNGRLKGFPKIPLFGIPPTRLVGPARNVLKRVLTELE